MLKKTGFTSILILFSVLVFLSSCSGGDEVNISEFSPGENADLFSNIEVVFSNDIAPADTVGKWSDTGFLTIEPHVSGKYKWLDSRTLYFSPDAPLEPIQQYSVKVTNKVLFNKDIKVNFDEQTFKTKSFEVLGADFFWSPQKEDKSLNIQVNLKFNYPVAPENLKKYLEVKLNSEWGGEIDIKSENPSETMAFELHGIKMSEKPINIDLTVQSGLMSVYGKEALEDSRSFDYKLPAFNRLSITGVSSGFDGIKGWIDIFTSQMADEKKAEKYIKIDPAKEFSLSVFENKIRLYFNSGDIKSVMLHVSKGLPGEYNGELEFDFVQMVSLVQLEPSLRFMNADQKYLLKSGEKNVEISCVNVNALEILVYKIFDNNLVHFLEYNGYYHSSNYARYYNISSFGKEILTKSIKLSSSNNWMQKVVLNFDDLLGTALKGIYVVQVRSEESRWVSDSRIISLSDNGIIARKGIDDITVFVNRLSSATPVENANIKVISDNNVTLLEGTSNAEGVCEFREISSRVKGYTPRMISVEKEGDYNYIDLNENRIETSRFDVGGLVEPNPNYRLFLYGPRNLYRPGEDVTIAGIVRDNKMGTIKQLPLKIKITTPNGKTFNTFKSETGSGGQFEITFPVPDFALTGQYFTEVMTGVDDLLGTYRFSIEDFVPDKIRVNLSSVSDYYYKTQKIAVDAACEFLYGGKASGLNFTADFQYRNGTIRSKTYPGLSFSSDEKFTAPQNFYVEGKLDNEGNAKILTELPDMKNSAGLLNAYMFFTVFDLTGRPVNKVFPFKVYSERHYSGIGLDDYYYSTNDVITANIGVINSNDEPQDDVSVKVELIRYDWQSVLKRTYSGAYHYETEKRMETVLRRDVKVNGLQKENFNISKSGRYEIRVYHPSGEGYASQKFYAYRWGSSNYSSFEVDREGRVNIIPDEEVYSPGETAKVLMTTPFDGRMLVTTERDGVSSYQYVNVVNKSVEVEIPITEDYLPNVYITATLFKPHTLESDTPFLVAHGYQSVKVEKKEYKIPLEINFADEIKPNNSYKVKIKAENGKKVYYSVAVVDEGILQIKNYGTPDPYAYMYAKQPLEVNSYDFYDQLLPEILNLNSSVGGDALAAELQKRANPIKSKRFKLVSLWSGMRETNSNGEAEFGIKIPQFNGELRIMALAFDGKSFGSIDKHVKAADDVIIEPEFPRVLTLGDTLRGIVTFVNSTKGSLSLTPSVKVTGAAKLVSANEASFSVSGGEMYKMEYAITSDGKVGTSEILFTVKGDAKVSNQIDFAVRPPSTLVKEYKSGALKPGEKIVIKPEAEYLEGSSTGKITIAKFPSLKFADKLSDLVSYPHGCIEQTVSRVFPLLYFGELAKLVSPDLFLRKNPVYYVNEGIRKLQTMQLDDGSMSYWQGGYTSSWWGTVYAAHFLVEAEKAGFNVPKSMKENILTYIKRKALEKVIGEYVTYSNGTKRVTKIAKKEIIYSLYVLALAGQPDLATMNYYFSRIELLTGDSKYLLAGAFALAGQMNSYNQLMPTSFEPEMATRETGGSFDSPIRANALKLNILVDAAPESEQISAISKYLSDNIKLAYSTQDKAWAFMGLGKAAKRSANSVMKVKISADGLKEEYNNSPLSLDFLPDKKGEITLSASGEGEVYYYIAYEGIPLKARTEPVNSRMKVTRKLFDYETGAPIENDIFRQGQLLRCEITLQGEGIPAENIVITDMIPSGFEIENSRLTDNSRVSDKGSMNVENEDIRDDRLILFASLNSRIASKYKYLLRVVNKGSFIYPQISAEAMYDNDFRSYNDYQKVIVK